MVFRPGVLSGRVLRCKLNRHSDSAQQNHQDGFYLQIVLHTTSTIARSVALWNQNIVSFTRLRSLLSVVSRTPAEQLSAILLRATDTHQLMTV
jgi:hypothetical protein